MKQIRQFATQWRSIGILDRNLYPVQVVPGDRRECAWSYRYDHEGD
jgi:hypothetical protein